MAGLADRSSFARNACAVVGVGSSLGMRMRTSLLNSLAEHPGADIAIIRGHLHSFDLLAALDANAKLLEAGTYNLAVCHTILLLLEVNEVRVGVRRGVETQFLQFEGRTIERYRQEFPEFNQALLNFWGAWEGTRPSTESYAS